MDLNPILIQVGSYPYLTLSPTVALILTTTTIVVRSEEVWDPKRSNPQGPRNIDPFISVIISIIIISGSSVF